MTGTVSAKVLLLMPRGSFVTEDENGRSTGKATKEGGTTTGGKIYQVLYM